MADKKYVLWMDNKRSKGMATNDFGGCVVPGREERKKKAEEWKAMLRGEVPVQSSPASPKSPAIGAFGRTRKKEATLGIRSVAVQVERQRIKKDRKSQHAAYLCSRCTLVVIGSERQALSHWLSKCTKQLCKMDPPDPPLGGFPPLAATRHANGKVSVGTQEDFNRDVSGVDLLSKTGSRLFRNSDFYQQQQQQQTSHGDEGDEDFKVNFFDDERSVLSMDFVVHGFNDDDGGGEEDDARMTALCEELQAADRELQDAFLKLQALEQLKLSQLTLSKVGRAYLGRRSLLLLTPVTALQRVGRGHLARRANRIILPTSLTLLARHALGILQKIGRKYLSRRSLQHAADNISSVLVIQRALREYLTRRSCAARVLQNYWRQAMQRASMSRRVSSSTALQRVGRGCVGRDKLRVIHNAVFVMQKVGRGLVTRVDVFERHETHVALLAEEGFSKLEEEKESAKEDLAKKPKKAKRVVVKRVQRIVKKPKKPVAPS
eukprot:TRINITY_DN4452_c0_g1_i1.p1 TRINITY_DN4452_c0_g1~~TRINITY_DN4452_c0_g1_i1.p1  ORF type:complete len:491 (+),score=119.32 TRINITY_DN4452_c0_g1_i1:1445-2917(+)